MAIRPKDLRDDVQQLALHCGDCVADYSARPDDYEWMYPSDLIVCQGCGAELVLEETTRVDRIKLGYVLIPHCR